MYITHLRQNHDGDALAPSPHARMRKRREDGAQQRHVPYLRVRACYQGFWGYTPM